MGFFNQLVLLLWKNFTLRKRQRLRLVAEILFPLALFMILVIVRVTKPDLKVKHPECHFDGKAMPSSGVIPFLQSFVCTFNNTCHEQVNPDEMSNRVGSFDDAEFNRIVTDIEDILKNNVDVELISDTIYDVNILIDLYRKLENGTLEGNLTLGNSVIDPNEVRQQILDQNLTRNWNLTSDVVDWLIDAILNRRVFQSGLNSTSLINILESLIPYPFVSENETIEYIRQEVCNETRLKEIFEFTNSTVSDNVHDELCNLSPDDFFVLVNDFVDEFDYAAFIEEITLFAFNNIGRNFTETTLQLVNDLRANNSWEEPFNDLQDVFRRIQKLLPNVTDAGQGLSGNIVNDFGQLFCGRSGTFLSIDEDQAERLGEVDAMSTNQDTSSTTLPPQTTTPEGNQTTPKPLKGLCERETTKECEDLFSSLSSSSSASRFLWRQVKPFIRGCILYYPQNSVTENIVYNAQQFFRELDNIGQLADDWMSYSPTLYNYLNNSDNIETLRTFVDSGLCTFAESYVIKQYFPDMNYTGEYCSFLKQYLNNGPNMTEYDWRDSIGYLDSFFDTISSYSKCFNFDKFIGYNDHTQMMKDGIAMVESGLFWAAVEFTNVNEGTLPTHISYKIRMDIDKVDSTKRVMDKYPRPGPRRQPWYLKYFMYGFVYIQDMIEHAIIKLHTGVGDTKPGVGIFSQQFPYPCYTEDKFIYAISRMLPLFLVLAWLLTTAMLCKSIVYEKDRRLKEIMKIMGLGNGVHWVAWFINAFVLMFATVLLLVLLLKVGNVLEYSDTGCILLFLTVFSVATIMKCFLISVFFSRPNMAACCAGFIYFMGYLPYMLMLQFDDVLTKSTKMAVGLSSNVAFGYGCNFIALWEEQAIGLQWNNFDQSPVTDDNFNMLDCIFMMIMDSFLYGFLTWYIEAIFPGQYGIPKPFYFPFTKSYWCGTSSKTDGLDISGGAMELNGQDTDNIEKEPVDKNVGVAVRNLKKMYSSSKKLAVDGLTINFYEGQITSFLGHNGAGKTTTIATSDLLERTQVSKLLLLQDQDRVGEFKNKCIDNIQLEDVVFDEKVVLDHSPTSGITVTDLMESDTGLTSPNLVMEALDEADAFFPDSDEQSNQKFRKRPSQPVKKIYWSKEEEEEINKLFKSFFDTKTWPKPSHCVRAIRISSFLLFSFVFFVKRSFCRCQGHFGQDMSEPQSSTGDTQEAHESILTGLFPPTEGTAFIHGKDIRTDMDHIRHSLGTCPQHNVLFDHLTVEEHLWFYARLKGSSAKEVKVEMEQMIKDVGLPHKRQEMSVNLSGGMKRKLSVAIAFVGNSKTVILDEPTAGVDPYARRAIWQLLLKLKPGRTIILSTHHMDEADVLGDRIAIISQGKLCCVGSSLFLKNRYGNGYYLTLVRADVDVNEEEILKNDLAALSRPMSAGSTRTITSVLPTIENEDEGYADGKSDSDPPTPPPEGSAMSGFSVKKTTALIQKFVPGARLVEDNMTELCYQLPDDAAARADFDRLFLELEQTHKEHGISSFGISDTSLEEVFLKVAEDNNLDEPTDETIRKKLDQMADGGRIPRSVSRLSFKRKKKLSLFGRKTSRVDSKTDLMEEEDTESVISGPVSDYGETGFYHTQHDRVTGWELKLRQFIAIVLKRFHHVRRSKKGFVVEVILPVVFILLAMTFALIAPPFEEEPPLELHPWHYEPKRGDDHLYMFYSNDGQTDNQIANSLDTEISKPHGVGNRCVNKHQIEDYPCEPVASMDFPTSVLTNETIGCDCSNGWQRCPPGAGGPVPPQVLLSTTDYLYNMTKRNISDWIVKTRKQYEKRRYGGLVFGEIDELAVFTNSTQIQESLERILTAANNGTQINLGSSVNSSLAFFQDLVEVIPTLAVRDSAKVWFNNRGWIASVTYINVMNNLILRSNLPSGVNPADYGITAINHPMEMTKEQLNDEALRSSFTDVVIAICVIFAMSFIPASFTMYLIEERVSNSKHLQFVSGVNPVMYWLSNFIWDIVNYLFPAVLCIFIFLAFNKKAYVSEVNGPCLVSLLFIYGWAMIPMMYPFSRIFNVPSTALVVLSSVNIFLGTVSTMSTFIIEFLEEDDPELKDINTILRQVFLLLPQYCLGRGLFDLAKNQLFADIYERLGEGNRLPNPFDWEQVGRNIFSMFCLGILFFLINLLIEYKFFIKSRVLKAQGAPLDDEDEDVARERHRVMSGNAKDDVLRIEELTKVFKARGQKGVMTAVDRLCVGVPKGQCFGLLGVNGAGKTTTFKMLTGDERPTKGNAYVNSHDVLNNMTQVRLNIGYCPQFDALDPLLTGVEHLRFYARLRGIPEKDVKYVADWAIRRLGLLPHADKISTNYSGGNKRKLSTAIALIGNPSLIFLDEPTTGMDPGARRFLWDCIANVVKDGRSVILTSHSMEECEALCGRLAIMVNGRFRCMGSIQHLKNRFGDGYTVIIRVSGESPDLDPVMDFFNSNFPQSVLKEKHHNMLQYQLGSDVKLSSVFGQIEAVRERLLIEDYSVSQTTLDQVFINFAKQQTDLLDDEIDVLPDDLSLFRANRGLPSEYEEQSLAGSTAELIRHEENRQSSRSLFDSMRKRPSSATSNASSLHLTNINQAALKTMPVLAEGARQDAPIISLPYQVGGDTGYMGDAYETQDDYDDEVIRVPRHKGRPVAKFDQSTSSSVIPDPEV